MLALEAGVQRAEGSVTIAVLTDLHYGDAGAIGQRRSEIADTLLERAVQRLNRLIRPDVTVVLGDVLDDGAAADATTRLALMRAILDKLASPVIVLPGNHDGDATGFYTAFDRPEEIVDLCGVRFLPFIDREAPGYNAVRSARDIARFQVARADHDGPIVALQHVCLAPPGRVELPYNYTNATEIVEAMERAGVTLSLSGHYHTGAEVVHEGPTTFVNAPSLCEKPFPFLLVTLSGERVSVAHHTLAVPEALGLVDTHAHTELAYCSSNMTVEVAISLAEDFGLGGIRFAEHSGHLYCDAKRYWGGQCMAEGLAGTGTQHERMAEYLDLKQRYERDRSDDRPHVSFGLEADVDYHGRLILRDADRAHFDRPIIGAVHRTPSLSTPSGSLETLEGEFMVAVDHLLRHDIDILAHPFRFFRRAGHAPPERLFIPVAERLRRYGVAVELNFHTNTPPLAFVQHCLERGLKFSLASDAHRLYEVGEFADHLHLLTAAGFDGVLSDILLRA
jgi:histidinol phosphatase-like PHP family hydrolase/calcineurin-like phosphoesterase family protein